jgi:sugar O-acyltransferase (sialic acid O-acetyltransferase NeuD family)
MSQAQAVFIPLINPNEPEAQLAALHVSAGQHVTPGDLLCTLETTKSTAEVLAEQAGYVVQLVPRVGQTLRAGEILCYLAEQPDWVPEEVDSPRKEEPGVHENAIPEGVRISQPAQGLARQLGLDFEALPKGIFITEKIVRELAGQPAGALQRQTQKAAPDRQAAYDPTAIVVYGGGGHGKALIDLLRALKTYRIVGIVDDGLAKEAPESTILGLPVLGGSEVLSRLYEEGVRLAVNAVGGIGNLGVRIQVFERLAQQGFSCPALVHPAAVVEPSASLSAGVQVFPLAYVGSEAKIGFGAIINTGAIVSHDCQVGDYANLSPGAILAGEVTIGESALIGMGVTVNLRAKVGRAARLGNSAVIKADVPEQGIVRAGTTWPT